MPRALKILVFAVFASCLVVGSAMAQDAGNDASMATVSDYANNIPEGDLSNQLVESIFGPVWSTMLADGDINMNAEGSGRLIGQISLVLNIAALALTGFLVVFTTATSALSTGYEGVAMGQRYSTLWVPLRIAVALIMLIPVAGGYSLAQGGVMLVGKAGAGVANAVYAQAVNYVVVNQGSVVPPSVNGASEIGANLLVSEVCMSAINEAVGPGTVVRETVGSRDGTSAWGFRYSSRSSIGPAGCGSYVVRENRERSRSVYMYGSGSESAVELEPLNEMTQEFHEQQIKALDGLRHDLRPLAQQIVADGNPKTDTYRMAVRNYRETLSQAATKLHQDRNKLNESTTNDNGEVTSRGILIERAMNQLKQIGWVGAGAVYWTVAKASRASQAMLNDKPDMTSANEERIRKVGTPDLEDASAAMVRAQQFVRTNGIVSIYNNDNDLSAITQLQNGAQGNDTVMAGLMRKVRASVTGDGDTISKRISDYVASNGSPIINGQAAGHTIVSTGEVLFLSYVALSGVTHGAAEGYADYVPFLSSGTSAVAGVVDAIGPVVYSLIAALFILGLVLSYGLPAIPLILWLFAVVNWLILLVEAVFACIVWAPAHAIPEGEGFTGSHARAGYLLLLALFMTPSLMLAGLYSAMVVMGAAGRLIGILFPLIVNDAQVNSLASLLGFLASMTILAIIYIVVVDRVFSMIHLVRDKILRWISGPQENLGEDQDNNRTRVLMAGVMSRFEGGAAGSFQPKGGAGASVGSQGGGGAYLPSD